MTKDVNVALLNMPTTTAETVTENSDGSFTIVINSRLSYERQLKAYSHALKHIESGDFEKQNVQSIEYQAHNNISMDENTEIVPAQIYLEKIKRLKREHRALKRQMDEYDSKMKLIGFDNDTLFNIAENQYLYGE